MAIKYPIKFLELVADGNITDLHKYLLKNKDKKYNLSLYAAYIAQNKNFKFFKKVCLDWSDSNPSIKKIILDSTIKVILKKEDVGFINEIKNLGVDFKDYSPTSLVYGYLKSQSNNKEIHEILKNIKWSEVEDKFLYSEIYDIDKLDKFLDIIGVENLKFYEKTELMYHSISYANKEMLDKLLSIGCSVYDENGKFNNRFFNKNEFFPKSGTSYGYITYRGRENVTKLFNNKTKDSEEWVNFVQKSFQYSESSEVNLHLNYLISEKLVNPTYPIDEKILWKKISFLEEKEIQDYLSYCEKIGVIFNEKRETMILKVFVEFSPEKIPTLVNFGIRSEKFLKSDYVKSIKNDSGFTRKRNKAVLNEMKKAILVLNASTLSEKLEVTLKEELKERKIKTKI